MLGLAVLSLLIAVYGALGARLARWSVTMPIVFVVVGLLLGPFGLGWLQLAADAEAVKRVTEVTLALLLFADASTLDAQRVREDAGLSGRLLLTGLLLTIALGGIVALLMFPGAGLGICLLIGAILAPTDAALGLPIFNNPKVPVRIRRALNVESGLNDGISTPFVTLFISLAISTDPGESPHWLFGALSQIAIAVLIGAVIGGLGGYAMSLASRRGWSSKSTEGMATFALALAAFATSLALGGNGFIAAFIGGVAFGAAARGRLADSGEYTEATGTILSLFVWTIFGAVFVPPLFLSSFNWTALLYAVLSLTLIRMLPVAIALRGLRMRRDTTMLMGWFGPRGLASVVFLLTAFVALREAGNSTDTVNAAVTWTILLSVFAHGLSAQPLASLYAGRLKTAPPEAPELREVAELGVDRRAVLPLPAARPSTQT